MTKQELEAKIKEAIIEYQKKNKGCEVYSVYIRQIMMVNADNEVLVEAEIHKVN